MQEAWRNERGVQKRLNDKDQWWHQGLDIKTGSWINRYENMAGLWAYDKDSVEDEEFCAGCVTVSFTRSWAARVRAAC
jgi:hypothetical protein